MLPHPLVYKQFVNPVLHLLLLVSRLEAFVMDWKLTALFSSLCLFGLLETLFPFFRVQQPFTARISANVMLGILNTVVGSLTVALLLKWVWNHPIRGSICHGIPNLGMILILSIFVLDAYMYTWHRAMHNLPVAWRFHQVHHTERAMNVSTAYRFHTIEVIASNIPKILLIWLFGIPPFIYVLYEALYSAELVFQHSNWRLPYQVDRLLSQVLVTPNYHRLHHSQQIEHSRSNYASFLTIWDRLFQSRHYPRSPKTIQLGLSYATKLDVLSLLRLPFQRTGVNSGLTGRSGTSFSK